MHPKVSIILPVYNVEEYLPYCLDTLVNQTMHAIEIICIDDGSTDDSFKILQDYAEKDKRIVVLQQPNKGAGAARNKGLEIARGTYLLFLDADDFFSPNLAQRSYEKALRTKADIVVFRADRYLQKEHRYIDVSSGDWKLLPNKEVFAATDVQRDIFRSVIGWTWDKLFRRSFIQRNGIKFQEISVHNDLGFTYTAFATAKRITVMSDILTHQRKRGGGSISDEFVEWECTYKSLKFLKTYLEDKKLDKRFGVDFVNYAAYLMLFDLNRVRGASYRDYKECMKRTWLVDLGVADADEKIFYDRRNVEKFKRILYTGAYRPRTTFSFDAVERPKVSVVMPMLNSMQYLEECLDSVENQTMTDIQILCVDAGSTDGTREFVEARSQTDRRVELVCSDKKSYGYQLNLGMELSRGEYIAIVESDDYVVDEMLAELYDVAKRYGADSVKCDFCRFYGEEGDRTFEPVKISSGSGKPYGVPFDPHDDLKMFDSYILNSPGIYARDFIAKNNIKLNNTPGASFQDNGLWFQIMMYSRCMVLHPREYYMLRRDNPNSSVNSAEKVFCINREYDYIRSVILSSPSIVNKQPYLARCAHRRFTNYMWTLTRIAERYRRQFVEKMGEEFGTLMQAGEVNKDDFTTLQWSRLNRIIDDPTEYYFTEVYDHQPTRTPLDIKRGSNVPANDKQLAETRKQRDVARREIELIHSSWTYRIGRFITYIPRKLRGDKA